MTEPRPHVLLSVATSIDGHIDDTTGERLLLSNQADFDRVDQVRAEADAVLVGANTLRVDDPQMLVRSGARRAGRVARGLAPQPLRVTVTGSGRLHSDLRWFRSPGDRVVYTVDAAVDGLTGRLGGLAEVVSTGPALDVAVLLDDLARRGVGRLLVEGGERIHGAFLASGLVDEIHLVVAPLLVGDGPRFVSPTRYPWPTTRRIELAEVRQIGDVVLLRYLLPTGAGG